MRSDGSHKDGTPDFINAISTLMSYQEGGMIIEAPAIELSTAELIRASGIPSDYLAWAHSCHRSDVACGQCRGCNKYFEVFEEVGYDLDGSR
ncbi:7-cyano-7-deazaguanine synthase [compost metagenome]